MTNYRNETVDLKDIIWDEACKLFSAKAIIPNREAFEKTANKYYITIDDEDWNDILARWTENMTWDELKKFLKKMKMTFREYSEKYYGFCDITEEEEEELKREGF